MNKYGLRVKILSCRSSYFFLLSFLSIVLCDFPAAPRAKEDSIVHLIPLLIEKMLTHIRHNQKTCTRFQSWQIQAL